MPEPDSPTMPSTFPRSRLKEMPLTARTSPASTLKEVQRFFTCKSGSFMLHYLLSLGSKASRRPSPSRLKLSTIRQMISAGKTIL